MVVSALTSLQFGWLILGVPLCATLNVVQVYWLITDRAYRRDFRRDLWR